jgi:ABC-type multidrug transport system permease subunit
MSRLDDSPLWQLTLSRLRGFFREPSAVFWTFGFPILLSLALGIAFRNRPPDPIDVAVESGPGAAALQAVLARSAEVKVLLLDGEEAERALRIGKVATVVVPGTPRTYRFDPTRPESRVARLVVDDLLQRADGRIDPTPVTESRITAPGSRYIDFLIPGMVGMGLMQSGLWGIGFVIVEMRTRKLVKRMVATPMRRSHFLAAFVLMRALFLIGELPVLLGFGVLAFGVPVRGSLILLGAISFLGAFVFSGVGLLVAARAKNTQTVGGLINLVSMPMFLFSGVFFSSARFPVAMQPFIRALPLTALNDALRAVMLDGAGVLGVARPTLVMLAWGVGAFLAALRLFRWR